jgi:hypothetical protein
MQRVRLLRRIVNTAVLGEKGVLRRNVFTVEGPGKGNGVPCFKLGEWEHDEVTELNNIIMYDHYRNTELADVARCLGVAVQLRICGRH